MINVTEPALNQLRTFIAEHKKNPEVTEEVYVRLGVKGGGCSGYEHVLALEEGLTEKDQVFELSGIKFLIDSRSALYLPGTTLDYYEDLMKRGFRFDNPQVKNTCGCGSSVAF